MKSLFKKLDIFSSSFQFNLGHEQPNKGTLTGFALTSFVFITTLAYFVYELVLFSTNQIEPNFRSQNFISDGLVQTELNNDLIGFKMDAGESAAEYANSKKTYLVYYAFFHYQNQDQSQFLPIPVIQCNNKNLEGYQCLDLSSLSNYTFALNTKQNLYSQIQIFTYACVDIDKIKTTIPDNCADLTESDALVNGVNAGLKFKIYTSQYNTTSQEMQVNYRNVIVYTFSSQSIITFLNMQTQTTSVKQGLIIQKESTYSSPIQYNQISQSMVRLSALKDGEGPYSLIMLQMDEIIQRVQIQYSTLPQVLALVNGIFSLLLLLGIVGRFISSTRIKHDFFMLFLQNFYSGKYFNILQQKKLLKQQIQKCEEIAKQESMKNENDFQSNNQINFHVKFESNQEDMNDQKQSIELIESQTDEEMDKREQKHKNKIPNFDFKSKQSLDLTKFKGLESLKKEIVTSKGIQRPENKLVTKKEHDLFLQQQDNIQMNRKNPNPNQDEEAITSQRENLISNFNNQYTGNFEKSPQNLIIQSEMINTNKKLRTVTFDQVLDPQLLQEKQLNDQSKKIGEEENDCPQLDNNIEKLKALQSKSFTNLRKQKNSPISNHLTTPQKKTINELINQDMNIFSFYKDIIFLKKAIMLLLDAQQLAAIKILGFSSEFLQVDTKNISFENLEQLKKDKKLSYLEEQFITYQSDQVQQHKLLQFLQRSQDQESINNLDFKILSSIP